MSRMFVTCINIPLDVRMRINPLLATTLAALVDMRSYCKQAHWNVKGARFYSLHLLFDELASELDEHIDVVAERIVALGGVVRGTLRMSAADTILPEYPNAVGGEEHLVALTERYCLLGAHLREVIKELSIDLTTQDLYLEISALVDKRLWFLEAHSQVEDEIVEVQ